MKKFIFFLSILLVTLHSEAQTKHYLRFDTVYVMRENGNGELALLNSTRDSAGGLLTNIGGGRTAFVKSRIINDTLLIIGLDTLIIRGSSENGVDRFTISGDATYTLQEGWAIDRIVYRARYDDVFKAGFSPGAADYIWEELHPGETWNSLHYWVTADSGDKQIYFSGISSSTYFIIYKTRLVIE